MILFFILLEKKFLSLLWIFCRFFDWASPEEMVVHQRINDEMYDMIFPFHCIEQL